MAASIRVAACAKVNLTLSVLGRRGDGYHLIESVMQSVQVCDRLHFDADVVLDVEAAPGIPQGSENLIWQAATALQKRAGVVKGARISVDKRIPVAAGMAGGSADAAATLVGLNHVWELGWQPEDLAGIGAQLGADVPFCIQGGTSVARGIGTELQPLPPVSGLWMVLANPGVPLATGAVYAAFDRAAQGKTVADGSTAAMVAALERGDPAGVAACLHNDLQDPACRLQPKVQDLLDDVSSAGALATVMTGSGPTVVGIARDQAHARDIAQRVTASWVQVASTVPAGCSLDVL